MGRGLGRNQRLVFETLQKIEREHNFGADNLVRVSYLLTKLYETPYLRARREAERERKEAQRLKDLESDDPKVRGLAELAQSINQALDSGKDSFVNWLVRGGERCKRGEAQDLERELNPSRLFTQLERRGLIERCWSGVRLTETGWRAIG